MNVEIAQRLSARRKQAGLSQEALAEQLGVSRQAVSKWERSESSPDTDNLIALAQLYGVSLDELLYVDDEMRDDVVFEAADRASEREGAAQAPVGSTTPPNAATATSQQATDTTDEGEAFNTEASTASSPGKKDAKVRIGFGGIHVLDGDDYVHVSWRDGVHVKDSKKGDEVHAGWSGIHVKEGSAQSAEGDSRRDREARAAQAWSESGDWRDAATAWHSADAARNDSVTEIPVDTQATDAASFPKEPVSQQVPWAEGVGASGTEQGEVVIDHSGVNINGEHFDDWRDAHERYGYGHIHDERWRKPCGYTVQGERFDTMDDARAKYGPEVGKSIPVRKHYLREFEKAWVKFPYPLVVIIVYLMLGVMNGAWGMGLFLFFTIPVYYMLGHAVGRKRIVPLIAGVYPLGVTAWFCYMAFVMNQPHPAWVMFLTIPLVEWLVYSLSHWWRARKRAKIAQEQAPIDVEAK